MAFEAAWPRLESAAMPLPLDPTPGAPDPTREERALLVQARERGGHLVEDLLRHRQELAQFRQEDPAAGDAWADGEAALERAIAAARRLVSDVSEHITADDDGEG